MNETRRRVIGIAAVVLLITALTALAVWRTHDASRVGWSGFTYVPLASKKANKVPSSFGFKPGGVVMVVAGAPADRAGIERGDVIVAINGIPANDLKHLEVLSSSVHTGDTVRFTVQRGETTRTVPIRFESPMRSLPVMTVLAINVIVGLTFVMIGLFVFLRRPADARTVVFYIMTLAAAASFVSGALAQLDTTNMRGIATRPNVVAFSGSLIVGATAAFFAPLLLHLALIFPLDRPVMIRRRRTMLQWIYGVPAYLCLLIAVLIAVFAVISRAAASEEKAAVKTIGIVVLTVICLATLAAAIRLVLKIVRGGFREGIASSPLEVMTLLLALLFALSVGSAWVGTRLKAPGLPIATGMAAAFIVVALFLIYPIATVVALFRSYRESGVEERRQVKWPLWGTMVAVATRVVLTALTVIFGFAVAFGRGFRFSPLMFALPDVIAKGMYVLIPLSFAFAILKYRLMNIDVIIRRTVTYTMLTGTIFFLYALLVAVLGTALVRFGGVKNQTVLIASTVVIALVTVPVRNRLQQLVDRNLFRERRDFPLALRNLGNAIGTSTAVDAFLRIAAEEVQQALQNRFVLIALRRDREFVAAAKVGVADEIVGSLRVPVDAIAFDSKVIPDALRRLDTTLVVPIAAHRQPTGFIALGSRLSDEEFSPGDVEFILAAAAQVAVGIENVRLRDEEDDFEQARAMQQILLPKSIPQLAGFEITGLWQPARSVGGDYFDILQLGDGRLGICIADVAGKGMPAALLMANLQAAVKATASRDARPADVCDRVKMIVTGNLAGGKFISLFYALLDAPTRTLTYCNAGHNPPIIVRPGNTIDRLMRGGPAICRLFQDAVHEQETTELQSGDRVVLFTDGVSEARRGEEEFGEDRLIQLLLEHRGRTAKELEANILTRLREFTAGDFSDDVTMIVIAANQ